MNGKDYSNILKSLLMSTRRKKYYILAYTQNTGFHFIVPFTQPVVMQSRDPSELFVLLDAKIEMRNVSKLKTILKNVKRLLYFKIDFTGKTSN